MQKISVCAAFHFIKKLLIFVCEPIREAVTVVRAQLRKFLKLHRHIKQRLSAAAAEIHYAFCKEKTVTVSTVQYLHIRTSV